MAIRRRCNGRTCKSSRRCLEHLWFDVMYRGKRFRMPVNEFAVPRMEPGKQRAVESLEEVRDWQRLFIGEIKAGRDPRRPRTQRKSTDAAPTDVAGFLDAYVERCVKPAALKSVRSICSRISVLKENLGELPLDSLEEPDDINRFKTDSDYAEEVELATMHRSLETLRAPMNWGMAQTPPLFKKSPFHRFGVRLNKKAETMRDRRLAAEEEKLLLDTALQKMNVAEHQYVGPLLHDRIIGALELCCRRGEMLLIQNKRVNWESCQSAFLAGRRRTKRIAAFRSILTVESRPFSDVEQLSDRRRTCLEPKPACASRTSRRPGRRFDCSHMESSRSLAEQVRRGTANSASGLISAGMTFDTKEPVVSWLTGSTSASFS
jgi:hypothetical protein